MSALENKAMIVILKTSKWGASKFDKKLADPLTTQYQATKESATVRKKLINSAALKPVRLAIESAKALHNNLTLPWGDHGDRLLPVKRHEAYRDAIQEAIGKVESERRQFVFVYDELVTTAEEDLGQMFSVDDYPSQDSLNDRFAVSYEIQPVPSASHFVADIGDDEAERIRADLERGAEMKLAAAMASLYERVEEAMRRLIERLGTDEEDNPKRIHSSALEALKSLAEAIPTLNIAEDQRLEKIAARIAKTIGQLEIDDLRYRSKKPRDIEAVSKTRKSLSADLECIAAAYFGPATPNTTLKEHSHEQS